MSELGDITLEIANDGFMPSQFLDRLRPNLSAEGMLVLAVFEDAIVALQKYHGSKYIAGRHEFELAYAWIVTGDMGQVSFDWACEVLKLDPDWIRERIKRFYGEHDPQAGKAAANG